MEALFIFALFGQVDGTAKPPFEAAPVERQVIWTPIEAVEAAAADLATIPQFDQPHQWYIWLRDSSDEMRDAMAYTLNSSTSSAIIALKPRAVADGQLLRLDLREWWPDDDRTDSDPLGADRKRFEEIISTYIDPYFYVDAGGVQDVETIGILGGNPVKILNLVGGAIPSQWPPKIIAEEGGTVTIACDPFTFEGKRYTSAKTSRTNYDQAVSLKAKQGKPKAGASSEEDGKDAPRFSPVIIEQAADAATQLQALTGRNVPIVEGQRWLVKSLSVLDGGLYYDLRGFRDLPDIDGKPDASDQEKWLSLWGADLDSKRRTEYIGQWESGVTFQPRRAVFGVAGNTRQSTAYPLVVVTEDVAEGSFDAGKHPIYTLGEGFEHDAVEALAMQSNGLIAYALFNGAGDLQDEAPPEIVADRTAPKGSTRLQPAISCIRCHGPFEGWQPMPNHVQTLLGEKAKNWRLRPIAELTNQGDFVAQLMEIAEKYSGDLTRPLQRARDDHAMAIFDITDGRKAPETAELVTKYYNEYVHDPISPQRACWELGVLCSEEEAKGNFLRLIPPSQPDELGLSLEDPAIQTIRLWGEAPRFFVNRLTWEANFAANFARSLREGSKEPVQKPLEN